LSLFAAVVTFAIYRWARKNIATCAHYRDWAVLERDQLQPPMPADEGPAPRTYPHGRIAAPAGAAARTFPRPSHRPVSPTISRVAWRSASTEGTGRPPPASKE
jgi:hypothetical protein